MKKHTLAHVTTSINEDGSTTTCSQELTGNQLQFLLQCVHARYYDMNNVVALTTEELLVKEMLETINKF